MSVKRSICSWTETSPTGAHGTTLSGTTAWPGAPSGRTTSFDRQPDRA
ncbi:hypothetical protein [Nonomuraea jabiensis]